MSKYSFLILSGGIGSRTELRYPKQFYLINGHPMVAYSIIAATQVDEIDEIIINYPEGFEEKTREIVDSYASFKQVKLVPAGSTRHESTRLLYEQSKNEHVIVHEAARPIINADRIRALISNPNGNVSYCEPISFSMCRIDPETRKLVGRIDRDTTLNIQLPQKFVKAQLADAHQKALQCGAVYTEDAMLCAELGGYDVYSQEGWSTNFKITTADDFKLAEAILHGLKEND